MFDHLDPDDPDDSEAFETLRDQLTDRFAELHGHDHAHHASQVLDLAWNHLGADPSEWDTEDLDAVLLDLYPAKVLVEADELAHVVPTVSAFLRLLGSEPWPHDTPQPPFESLAQHVASLEVSFLAAMHDETRFSPGKRIWSEALADGVDLTDQAAIEQWIAAYNERPVHERHPTSQPTSFTRAVFGTLPPVTLLDTGQLESLASDTSIVRRLQALCTFIGDGRPLTDKGNLKLADGKELVRILDTDDPVDECIGERVFRTRSSEDLADVDHTFRLALVVRLLEHAGRRVVPGPNADRWTDEPLELVYAAMLAMLRDLGPTAHRFRGDHYDFGWFAETLDEQWMPMFFSLYRDQAPTEVEDLVETAWDVILDRYDLDDLDPARLDFQRSSVEVSVRHGLDRFAELGIVEWLDEERSTDPYGLTRRSGGSVALAPLGTWAMQRFASSLTDAPVVGALRSASAAELLRSGSDLPETLAAAEIDAWVDHHGERAAVELCDALRDADETARGLAFRALLRLGASANDAVETLRGHAVMDPFVTVFRVDTLQAEPDEMSRADDPGGWVALLATVLEVWGPEAMVAAWAEPAAGETGLRPMLDRAWRCRDRRTLEVLAAIGAHHPDKHLAKAARKSVFKYRDSST